MKELSFKTTAHAVEVKGASEDGKSLHITGYACAFGNVDSWGDIIESTACDKFLKSDNCKRLKLCYQHEMDEVIGVITNLEVDEVGLKFEADIIDTTKGEDVQKLIKAGAINEFSIGYYADEWHEEKDAEGNFIRHLDAITIVEISPVTRAANPKAVLLDAKSEDFVKDLAGMKDEEFEKLHDAINDEYARRVLAKV